MDYQGKKLIVIWVKGGNGRPYTAPDDVTNPHSVKYCYIRKFSSTIRAQGHELKELYAVSETIPYDDRMNPFAQISDLSPFLIKEYLKEVGSAMAENVTESDLKKAALDMQLLQGPPEDMHPVNAALLFFCSEPERFFRYAYIDVVVMPDPTGQNMIEKRFTGPIHYQLRDALRWLRSNVIEEKVTKEEMEPEATRTWNYPYAALEEILSNAVYHKSYQVGEPITVRVTSEYIEVTSHPGFDISISEEDIRKYTIRSRIYRNRRIGDFLKELRLIEGRNTGFPTALAALQKNGSEPLRFEYDELHRYLSVQIPIHRAFKRYDSKEKANACYRETVLSMIRPQPLTLTDLARQMGYKGITQKLKNTVNQLLAANEIEYILDSSGHRKIAIRRR